MSEQGAFQGGKCKKDLCIQKLCLGGRLENDTQGLETGNRMAKQGPLTIWVTSRARLITRPAEELLRELIHNEGHID